MIQARRLPNLAGTAPLLSLAIMGVMTRSPIALLGLGWMLGRMKLARMDPRERFRLRQLWQDRLIGLGAGAVTCWIFGRSIYQLFTGH